MALEGMRFETVEPAIESGATISTRTVRAIDELAPHLAAWDRLAWDAPQKMANLLPAWVDAYLRHRLGPQDRWLCIFAYAGEGLVGVMPVVVSPHPVLGAARPVLRAPYDALTPSGDIVLDPAHGATALRAMLGALLREVPHHLGIDFHAVRRTSPLWNALAGKLDGYVVRTGSNHRFACLDVSGTFAQHLAGLGKLRGDLRRYRRKLAARGNIVAEVNRSEGFLSEFIALESSGWKGRNRTSIADHPKVGEFYGTLVRNFVAQDRWEWHALRVDGQLVAAQMGVRCGSSLTLPKIAFDETFAEGRPGTLSSEEVLASAFARPEIDEVNPMSDGSLHRLWHMDHDSYGDIHLVRRTAMAAAFQLPRVGMRSIYERHVRPRIPAAVKKAYQEYRRRGGRKPRRANETGSGLPRGETPA